MPETITIATPTSKSGTSTNNIYPQSIMNFKKIKPGSPRKAALGKKQVAFATTPVVCGLCEEVGHKSHGCK
jgi:hypothetical protein